jgi:hypothetical protein
VQYEFFSQKACCGKTVEQFRFKRPMTEELFAELCAFVPGLTQDLNSSKHLIIRAESPHCAINGSFGSNMFQVKNIGQPQGYCDTLELIKQFFAKLPD